MSTFRFGLRNIASGFDRRLGGWPCLSKGTHVFEISRGETLLAREVALQISGQQRSIIVCHCFQELPHGQFDKLVFGVRVGHAMLK